MRLSFNEIRARAASFAKTYADATYEKGETQTFYNDFFAIFGVERRSVARYEEHVRKLNNRSGFIDLFWPRVLLVEQKSAGRDLAKASIQAGEYFDALKETERPRFQLLCDFQMPLTKAIVGQVREYRLGNIPAKGKDPDTIKKPGMSSLALAETPTAFHVTVTPTAPFLVMPEVSSERREYAPIGFLDPPTIPSNLVRIMAKATPAQFALLTSAMHMAWLRTVGGAAQE